MCEKYCGDRGFLWRSVGLPEVAGGEVMREIKECKRTGPTCSKPNLPVSKNPERECKGFGTVYLTDIRDAKNRNFRVYEDQNPLEIYLGEGLRLWPSFSCLSSRGF